MFCFEIFNLFFAVYFIIMLLFVHIDVILLLILFRQLLPGCLNLPIDGLLVADFRSKL